MFLVVLFPLLVLAGGFATDISLLNAQKRYVQSQADLAAQSAARHLPDVAATRAAARRVVAANGNFGRVELADADIQLGSRDASGAFVPAANQTNPSGASAVRVTVRSPFRPILLSPILSEYEMTVRRSATAANRATVVFILRNRLLGLNTRESILDALLGPLGAGVTVNVLSYEGLANTRVKLNELLGLASLGLAVEALTFDDVLDLPLSLATLLTGLEGTGALPAGSGSGVPDRMVSMNEILAMSPDLLRLTAGDILPDVGLDAFDLLTALAGLASDPEDRVDVSAGLDLAPLADVRLRVGLIRPQVIAVGLVGDVPPPRARVAQVGVFLEANVLALGQGALLRVALALEVGSAEAVLTGLNCSATLPSDRLATFQVETQPIDIALRVGLLDSSAGVAPEDLEQNGVGGGTKTVHIRKDQFRQPVAVENPLTLSGLVANLGGFLNAVQQDLAAQASAASCLLGPLSILCSLGQIVAGLAATVLAIVTPILDGLAQILGSLGFLDGILQTLLDILGISLAQADLILYDYSCAPRLVQ